MNNDFLKKYLRTQDEDAPPIERTLADPFFQAKLESGLLPADLALKTFDYASEQFKKPIKQITQPLVDDFSDESVMTDEQRDMLLKKPMLSPIDLGMAFGGQISPRGLADVARDVVSDPRTYLYGAAVKGARAEQVAKKVAPAVENLALETMPKGVSPEAIKKAPEFAGSIRLNKFPEQMQGLIKEAADTLPNAIKEAQRGVMSFAQQNEMAQTIKPQVNLDMWKAGDILNAENRRAAALNIIDTAKSAIASNDATLKQKVIDDIVKLNGLHSEAGRLLGSLRDPLFNAEGDALKQIAKELPQGAEQINRFLKDTVSNPTFWDKTIEFHTAKLLTNPITYERNFIGNTIGRLIKIPERLISGGYDAIRSAITRTPRQRYATEAIADFIGTQRGMSEGLKRGLDVLLGKAELEGSRAAESGVKSGAIKGIKGEVTRTPFRILNAFDEFAQTTSKTASYYSQAYRQAVSEKAPNIIERTAELIKNPSIEMIKNASKEALDETYRGDLGKVAGGFNKVLVDSKVGKLLQPFYRTPVNIAKFALQRSPLGILSPKNISDVSKGGGVMTDALARISLGSALSAYFVNMGLEGNLTAQLSNDKAEREAMMRRGIQPYSIKIGGKWHSYRGLEPISTMLSLSAGMAEQFKDKDETPAVEKVTNLIGIVSRNLIDQPFLSGARGLLDAMEDPKRFGEQFTKNMARTFGSAPAFGYVRNLTDSNLRETDNAIQALMNSYPILSRELPEKVNVWGEPIKTESNFLELALSPVRTSKEKQDPFEDALIGVRVGYPSKYIGKEKLSNDEYRQLVTNSGQIKKGILTPIVLSPAWAQLPPEAKQKIVDDVEARVHKSIREQIRMTRGSTNDFEQWRMKNKLNETGDFLTKYGRQ